MGRNLHSVCTLLQSISSRLLFDIHRHELLGGLLLFIYIEADL